MERMTISLVLAVSCFLFCFFLYLFDAPHQVSSLLFEYLVSSFSRLVAAQSGLLIKSQLQPAVGLKFSHGCQCCTYACRGLDAVMWANALETAYTLRNLLIQRSAALSQAVHWNAGLACHSILSALHSLNATFREYSSFSSRSFSYIGQLHVP
jgi:hypothetical protein